jgi:amino acid permease
MGADMGGASGASTPMAIQSLIRIFVGVGILSLSYQVKNAGIGAYTGLLIILSYIALWCILRLSEACDLIMKAEGRRAMLRRKFTEERHAMGASPTVMELENIELFAPMGKYTDDDVTDADKQSVSLPTLTEVGIVAYGYWGGVITDASIIITQIGACVAYTIFISGTMSGVTGLNEKIWIAILWIPLILLSMIRDMAKLAIFSSLANVVYIYTLSVIFYQGYTNRCCIEIKDAVIFDYTYIPMVFGSLSFALEGIALVLPIRNRMKYPSSFTAAMSVALVVVSLLYFGVANVGYLFYGVDTEAPLTKNLIPGTLTNTVKYSLSMTIFITFAMAVFPVSFFNDTIFDEKWFKLNFQQLRVEHEAREAEESLMNKKESDNGDNDGSEGNNGDKKKTISNEELVPQDIRLSRNIIQIAHRIAFVSLCCLIALVLPDFHLVVALFGAFSNALLAYILPALFWIRICTPEIFNGVIWYPYDRNGKPNRPYEGSIEEETDINYLTSQDGFDADNKGNQIQRKSNHNEKINETAPLVLNTAVVSDGPRKQRTNAGCCTRISYTLFPYTVAVVGSLASVVSIISAVKELIESFHK